MRARVVFVFALWTSLVIGAAQLLQLRPVAGVAAAGIAGGALAARLCVAARRRWRRVRSWPKAGAADLYPAGPRRVLLAHTGLEAPRSRVR